MSSHRPRLLAAGLTALALAACTPDRPRPGPPSITLELPVGHVVASPDTFAVGVRARDDNGLDSVVVTFLDERREVFAFNEIEVVDFVFFIVPEGRIVGELVDVQAFALDLVGGRTTTSATLTIIARDTASP
ncbi:MAG TPA: hypothetical protein VGA02_14855 [Gemmatimonadales bacterium]|jgi:hypothetical protein